MRTEEGGDRRTPRVGERRGRRVRTASSGAGARVPPSGLFFRLRTAAIVPLCVFLLPAVGLHSVAAQEVRFVRGVVIDLSSRAPIGGVYIFASETQTIGLTVDDGSFEMMLPEGPQRLVLSRVGYGETEVTIDPRPGTPLTIGLQAVPEELPGLEVEGRSFQARIDSINVVLDRSAKGARMYQGVGARGVPRFATVEEIRRYDDASDPTFAFGALGVTNILMDDFCAVRVAGREVSPTIFIDGRKQNFLGCDRLREMSVSQICRMELIPFPRGFERKGDPRSFAATGSPSHDLYVWSCGFMARLATDQASVPELFDILVPVWWSGEGRLP